MQKAKLDILVSFFSYGGNGGVPMCLPSIRRWWAAEYHRLCEDERIGKIAQIDLSDTPITLTRNQAINAAKKDGYDLLLMVDSDNEPDMYVGSDPYAKPFLETSIEFAYDRLIKGIPTVIGAPYCGTPRHPVHGGEENVYVFKWLNYATDEGFQGATIAKYDRDEAARMTGISPVAALPTGLILFTTNVFDCIHKPYVQYEFNEDHSEKKSTEDVYLTRNLAMAGVKRWGTEVVFCAWNSWAGHHKTKCVGKPIILYVEQVADTFAKAVKDNFHVDEDVQFVNPESRVEALASVPKEEVLGVTPDKFDEDFDGVPYVEPEPEGNAPPEPDPAVYPVINQMVGGSVVNGFNGVVNKEERDFVRELLEQVGEDHKPKRMLYVGWPDPAMLAVMHVQSHGGSVYCVCDPEDMEQTKYGLGEYHDDVKFLPFDAFKEVDSEDVDVVFIHCDAVVEGHLEHALLLANDDKGIVVGNISTDERESAVFDSVVKRTATESGLHVHETELGVWAVYMNPKENGKVAS